MPSDVSIIVADSARLIAIRDCAKLPGRLMPFASGSIGSAIASIRAYRPRTIAVDAVFAESTAGAAFIEQVEALAIGGCTILLVVQEQNEWVTMPRSMARVLTGSQDAAVAQALAAVSNRATPVAASTDKSNTRRAPRFLVRAPLNVVAENGRASLVDLSTLGAQIVSQPVLRPRQKIKLALPDSSDTVSVVAQVAWSTFERPRLQVEPYYRVGLEFAGAAQDVLEEFRRRHCAEQPIQSSAR